MGLVVKSEEKVNRPVKVIQFGEGNFLRGFVDWMIHRMNQEINWNGSVAIVQPLKQGLVDLLSTQDYEYTHYLKGIKDGTAVSEHYINESISMGVKPYEDFHAYLNLAHIDSANIIVSNTTEAGIIFQEQDQFENEADVSYPGKLTRLMFERFTYYQGATDKGYILLPCELIDYNADRLKEAVLAYIEAWKLGAEFRTWVLEANTFCNTLVDRIVPGYPRETIDAVWEELGYKDQLVVESEQFNLWVIEGNEKVQQAFPANEAGCNALFVDDVTPYKMRKVRILNGAHTTLVPVAYLMGVETVRESVEHDVLRNFLYKAIFEEIIPTLTLSQEELEIFAAEVIERFKNPFIKHYLMSISLNSMSKYKARVLPSVLEYMNRKNELPKRLVFALAAYIVFYSGKYNEKVIEVKDSDDIMDLYQLAYEAFDGSRESLQQVVEKILSYSYLWEGNLSDVPKLQDAVVDYAYTILTEGIEKVQVLYE
ncbi:MAG: tagaturonate reductase [Vallitaleaceae bacterium]|nr:tagaturonate reductase [Vallitaleaceae bacterium]